MKKYKFQIIYFLLFSSIFYSCSEKELTSMQLPLMWEFEYDSAVYSATVPGCIHTDLLSHDLIPDPFFRCNEDSVQWVALRSWKYRTTFTKNIIKDHDNIELVFEGLDGVTEVILNGKPLIHTGGTHQTDNMFRSWVFPINVSLLKEINELTITFLPTIILEEERAKTLPFPIPEKRALTRKAQYQSGWDWGPKLITCGIWKPAYLRIWNNFRITDCQVYQKDISDSLATLLVETEIEAMSDETINLSYYVDNIAVKSTKREKIVKGRNVIREEITVMNPERWWPNGLGEQKLYSMTLKVNTRHHIDTACHRIGLRTVELVQEEDSVGKSFMFRVNEIPVFMKGTNWIPSESFPSSMSTEKYNQLLSSCKESNMNMIRIWGGGIYEDDLFYELCDEMGILVWQDFMFAGAIYPDDQEFLDNIKAEAVGQVKRLRNHPSLAIWCGNNEVKNAWEDWGWKSDYTTQEQVQISKSISAIFDSLLAVIVSEYDEGRAYHPTSPLWGWGHPESFTEGDAHYWGVWWGEEPFEVWESKTGRFMSEYGFQSYPQRSTIDRYTLPEDCSLLSAVMKNHQKHGRGVEIISNSMKHYFDSTTDFDKFIYISQLVQAYGYGEAIEAHRRKKPYCMGTLYWQLNDCWPVASWSTIDYYGNKKAAWFTCRDKFSPIIISTQKMQNGVVPVWLISDEWQTISGNLEITIWDILHNKLLYSNTFQDIILEKNQSKMVLSFILPKNLLSRQNQIVMQASFLVDGEMRATKNHYFVYPKELSLQKPDINIEVNKEDNGYCIVIESNTLTKGVCITPSQAAKGDFSDNYFDLLPGERKTLFFSTSEVLPEGEEFQLTSYH